MGFKRPSPAMVVACVALFVALGGTSFAAVNYARNAGKVDGKSAVRASRSLKKAAGNLVATYKSGRLAGQIPHKFLAETPLARPFGKYLDVADNAASAPVTLTDTGTVGSLTATCGDQAAKPGVENPVTTITFVDDSGAAINVAKRVGNEGAEVGGMQNGTISSVVIRGSNTFEFLVNLYGATTQVEGVVRQDGSGSTAAHCLVYGTALQSTDR
jgi:hypothetical protein